MTRRKRLTLALAAMLLLPLSGCSTDPVDLQAAAAQQFQAEVLAISEASAAGDFDNAQSLLSAMQDNLRTAAASGQVSAERSAAIQSAINLVRDDLTVEIDAAIAAAEEAAAAAAEAAEAAENQNDEDAKDRAEHAKEDAEQAKKDAEEAKKEAEDAREDREDRNG